MRLRHAMMMGSPIMMMTMAFGNEDDDNDDHKLSKDNDDHVFFCTVTLFLVLKFLNELFFKTDCFSTYFSFTLF